MAQRKFSAGGIIRGDGGSVKAANPRHLKLVMNGKIGAKKAVSANLELSTEVTNRGLLSMPVGD